MWHGHSVFTVACMFIIVDLILNIIYFGKIIVNALWRYEDFTVYSFSNIKPHSYSVWIIYSVEFCVLLFLLFFVIIDIFSWHYLFYLFLAARYLAELVTVIFYALGVVKWRGKRQKMACKSCYHKIFFLFGLDRWSSCVKKEIRSIWERRIGIL